jgi:VRR-NUC domain-containing protein
MSAAAKPRRAPYRLTAPAASEHQSQRTVTDVLRLEVCREGHVSAHGVCWFSIDMAHYAGVPGTRVARGICAGVPDVVVLYRGAATWIELKADGGSLSDDQRAMCAALLQAGCRYAVARDERDVLAVLDAAGIPRAHRVRIAA